MSISSHVLDATTGRPASGMRVELSRAAPDGTWVELGSAMTDRDGRVGAFEGAEAAGVYRLTFAVRGYFAATFYPEVIVTFVVADAHEHLHVPLLLSPYAYSTYRGS